MLKFTLNKDEFAALDAGQQALYSEDGDNYKLGVEGLEDTGALKRAKDREAQNARDAKARAEQLEQELADIRGRIDDKDKDALRKSKDIDALEKSWKETADKRVADERKVSEGLKRQMEHLLVGNVANTLATELFTTPEIAKDFVAKRLRAEFDGDTPITRVLDKDGNPSALTLEEFKRELLDTPALKGILIGSKASGGGAGDGGSGGGATKPLSEMNQQERVDLYKKVGEQEFNRIVAQSRG